MQTQNRRLGPLETKFFSWAQSRRIKRIRTGDLVKFLAFTPKQEADLLTNMGKSGLIVQLMRGYYLVPERLPPGGRWTPSPYLILKSLMQELQAQYQITGLSAFNAYGFETQIPNEICVYNTVLSGRRKIAGLSFQFVKVVPTRIGGTRVFNLREDSEADAQGVMSSEPRALLDAIYDYSRFNTLPRAYLWIAAKKSDNELLAKLTQMSIEYGNVSTRRRLGYLFEHLKINPKLVAKLKKSVLGTTSFIPFVPEKKPRGTTNRKWGLVVNYRVSSEEIKNDKIKRSN